MAGVNHQLAIISEVPDAERPEDQREYRKANWTLHETMVLIAAKKLDDERRLRIDLGEMEKTKTAELRWKWVENYCWKNGCRRSLNQCNDKWDNLMRDYKKVRDHEIRVPPEPVSYWQMEKHERREKGLPSNLLIQVYDALHDIIDRRFPPKILQPHQLPAPSSNPPPPAAGPTTSEGTESESEDSGAPKRRKVSRSSEGLAPAIYGSTVQLTHTILACEEKEDRRHKDLLGVEERKLLVEEAKTEISRIGVAGLISAVNNLASAILTLAAEKSDS